MNGDSIVEPELILDDKTPRIRKPSLKLVESVVNQNVSGKDGMKVEPQTVLMTEPFGPANVTPNVSITESTSENINKSDKFSLQMRTPTYNFKEYIPVPDLPPGWTMRAKARTALAKSKGRVDICYRW